jgi:SAM-dependent methyltransferase
VTDPEATLREAWEAQALAWAAWARTPGHDYFFWRFNLPQFLGIVPAPGELTVDIGAGEGRVSRVLAERGHRVVAIDSSPTLACLTATHENSQRVLVADAAAIPLLDGVADLAIAFMSLQDIDDLDGAVREMARVLRPGGSLCIAVLHPLATAGRFVDDSVASPFLITDAYPQPRRTVDAVERDGIGMVFHSMHRPLGAYSRALSDAGFAIEVLSEGVPDAASIEDYPRLDRQTRIPWYLHLRARRE